MNSPQGTTGLKVGDIFREYGEAYRSAHELPLPHLKVMNAIEKCRTEALGGHVDECDTCGYRHPFYNQLWNKNCGFIFQRKICWLKLACYILLIGFLFFNHCIICLR